MRLWSGTSGFSYKEWKGSFYPEKIQPKAMLEHYAGRLNSVEINATFYRMPRSETLRRWAEVVPDDFRFVLKANRRITHTKRLRDADDPLDYMLRTALDALGDKLGPILFQLPPWLPRDVERLRAFLELIPDGVRSAFEFRHESWGEEEVDAALAARNAARVAVDAEGGSPQVAATADFGYARLRRPAYERSELAVWAERLAREPWRDAFVFFKHEDEGSGPKAAHRFRERWGATGTGSAG